LYHTFVGGTLLIQLPNQLEFSLQGCQDARNTLDCIKDVSKTCNSLGKSLTSSRNWSKYIPMSSADFPFSLPLLARSRLTRWPLEADVADGTRSLDGVLARGMPDTQKIK
jgi:hypothetical protein